jgi:Protein of unknown function (DUF2934)
MAFNPDWTESVRVRHNFINNGGRSLAMIERPSKDKIERRAYAIYLERGAQDGLDITDWLMAEQELIREAALDNPKIEKKREAAAA